MVPLVRPGPKLAGFLIGLILLAGCAGSQSSAPVSAPDAGGATMAQEAPAVAPAAPADVAPAADGVTSSQANMPSTEQQQISLQRLVIRNADLSLQVTSVEQAEATLRAKINELGGYIVGAESSGADTSATLRVTFRVPSDRFDAALSGLEGLAEKVVSRSISGEDVTEEYVDLESQLRNLEATRDRLLSFLEKATRVEDALQVNQAITEVQGQIEQIQGRMKYLKQSSALSTITVFLAPVPTTTIVEEDAWRPAEVARAALRDLLTFGQGLANLVIVLGIWAPIWLPLLLLGRWGWLRLSATRRSMPPAPPAPPTPPAPEGTR